MRVGDHGVVGKGLLRHWGIALPLALLACGGAEIDLSHNTAVAMSDPSRVEPCASSNPLRDAFFGDLHVHTSYSSDGWMWGVRLTPRDAYRYAFGETVSLPPNDASDQHGTRRVRIDRPLDFAAVTDHAEFLGESQLCTSPESEPYASDFCREYRKTVGRSMKLGMRIFSPIPWRQAEICGEDGERCALASRSFWSEIIRAAEDWNDRSDQCERTTFIGYEYTSHRMGSNLHRNVIYRNHVVPPNPVSYIEAPREWSLWSKLKADCLDARNGCDVLAIPHNSNISNGRMFAVDYPGAGSREEQQARAALRARMEPLVEVMQHKGDSECRNGVPGVLGSADELCNFEKFENMAFSDGSRSAEGSRGAEGSPGAPAPDPGACYEGPLADYVPHLGPDCISRLSYVRYALTEGLKEEARLGVNPFKFGLGASTDTHNGLAGGVMERGYAGHIGTGDDTVAERVAWDRSIPGNASNSPGGLIGIWAEQNRRDSLFDAMRRKEVFGTSGPRIQPRLFGSWSYPAELCGEADVVARADAGGVPMGADLPARTQGGTPAFVAMALADPGTSELPGTPLQRLQVIKGWVDDEGTSHQRVYDIAGDAHGRASVDLDTCRQRGAGHAQLCSVWSDPDFDPTRRAVYYLRAVENPSCRYSAWQCISLPESERPADCRLPQVRRAIQERAWSSPIWYTPAG